MSKLVFENVQKRFGNNHVLRGLNLQIEEGESVVVIGGSGTGKSVLLKSALGIVKPDSGRILLDGTDITRRMGVRERDILMHRFGMLFQGGALFDSLKVWENIAFRLIYHDGWDRMQARAEAIGLLGQVGLSEAVAESFPAELSGGMQKRVALARAICGNPEIVFFDEPTTGLDPIMADVINDLIIRCTKERGLTTLTITHDMASATKIADRVAMLYQGEIIWQGRAQDIYHSKNPYVDQFVHGRAQGPITDTRHSA